MLFRIDFDSSIPIYKQIEARVIFGVASGSLRPGELIKSVRELAPEIFVHPNTVARAYQELERQGVLVARRGKGMEVTADAPRLCLEARREILRARLRDVLHEAVSSSLPVEEIRRLVEEELARANGRAQ